MASIANQKEPSLELEDLGDLTAYSGDDLLWLRERLVMDVEDIQAQTADASQRIKDASHERHVLQEKAARRARALRAVKHTLKQRGRAGADHAEPEAD